MVDNTRRGLFYLHYNLPRDETYSLAEIADITGVPKQALQEVYNRGVGAWKSNIASVRVKGTFKKDPTAPRSEKLGREQWAMARVYSFLMGGKTQYTTDADIVRKYNLKIIPYELDKWHLIN